MIEKLRIDDAVARLLNRALKLDGFFPEFTADHAQMIFLRSGLYLYAKGTRVVEQGEKGRDLYVLEKGKLDVLRKEGEDSKRVAVLKDGDIFGEIGMLKDGVRSATVVAAEDSRIFRLVYQDIQYLLLHNKELGDHLSRLIAQRSGLDPDG